MIDVEGAKTQALIPQFTTNRSTELRYKMLGSHCGDDSSQAAATPLLSLTVALSCQQ
jgi:hypothetical protein